MSRADPSSRSVSCFSTSRLCGIVVPSHFLVFGLAPCDCQRSVLDVSCSTELLLTPLPRYSYKAE